jgi:hypothetical protein
VSDNAAQGIHFVLLHVFVWPDGTQSRSTALAGVSHG